MLSSPILSSSLLLLQYLTVSVWGTPTPQADDFGDRFPTIPDDPTPPPRPCDAAGCRDPTYQLPPSFFPGQDIFVILFGRPGRYQSTSKPDINQILKGYLQDSLPYFLKQLTPVPSKIPDLVKEGIPLLVNAILSTLGANDMKDVPKLQAWAKKVYPKASCDLFAAAALPAYLAGFDTVYFANNPKQVLDYGAKPSIPELDYFIQPAYGPISHNDGVTIFYNAKFPAFFGQRHVFSEARDVFVRSPAVSHSQASLSNPEFSALVKYLLYQFGHVKKWSEVDYLDSDYEMQYLKGLCEANFAYRKNQVEQEVFAASRSVGKLLDKTGSRFHEVWRKLDLFKQLGLPKEKAYSPASSSCSPSQIYTLKFEKGDLQIKKCGACSRTVFASKANPWVGEYC